MTSSQNEHIAINRLIKEWKLPTPTLSVKYLRKFLQGFSKLTYENFSKIIRYAETKDPSNARRGPEILISDHFRYGAGGTCFSLTYLAYKMLLHLGFPASIVMGDRRYGENTHCAVICSIENLQYLLDVGFLIYEPIPLEPNRMTRIDNQINQIELEPNGDGNFDLFTLFRGQRKFRFTIKTKPLNGNDFFPYWDATFGFTMMKYPLATCMKDGLQYYLKGNQWQIRTKTQTDKRIVALSEIPSLVKEHFRMDPAISQRVLQLTLKSNGMNHG